MNISFNRKSGVILRAVFEGESNGFDFDGKENNFLPIISSEEKTLLMGLGKKDKLTADKVKILFFNAYKELKKYKFDNVSVAKGDLLLCDDLVLAVYEGFLHSSYSFDKYKSEKEDFELKNLDFEYEGEKVNDRIEELTNVMKGVFLTRDLTNTAAMDLYPKTLVQEIKKEFDGLNIDVEVFGRKKIEQLGMKAYLSVSLGSDKEPQFIIMHYKGSDDEPIALVGKGVTYDSGGYSIKPAEGMATMHCDMAGSATVVGALKALALNGIKKNVYGVVAATENLINGSAYKTGDIIGSLSGKTIEVANTDAEGRLTLADALFYTADTIKPKFMIDMATLTGAMVVSLGWQYTGAITNNQELMDKVIASSKKAGEYVWQMPSDDFYKKYNESKFADIRNIGGRYAGGITAGMFLGEFVKDTKWVHLDIAGPAYLDNAMGYYGYGATGVMVKTIYQLVKDE
ncbi:MAG: leucyl aminopeptidase [Clostridiales bacterium]|nr:MAG: leucyl aminopeptidase [Clostridiales bacterium]